MAKNTKTKRAALAVNTVTAEELKNTAGYVAVRLLFAGGKHNKVAACYALYTLHNGATPQEQREYIRRSGIGTPEAMAARFGEFERSEYWEASKVKRQCAFGSQVLKT